MGSGPFCDSVSSQVKNGGCKNQAMGTEPIVWMTATEMAGKIRSKELSAREVLDAHLTQIEAVNPPLNAMVTVVADRAIEQATAADDALARGDEVGVLHGLPVAHKDLHETAGIRTTLGSPIYADWVPDRNTLIVQRMIDAGAITVGKTNTPEFGAGSQTFNTVFGTTVNPWDTSKTCGGSSGGAAVALATGMAALADGSDMGGSLRNPASFCNIVGFRPSPGRVPVWPSSTGWSPLAVHGPMARTAEDIALFMSAIAGADRRVPISLPGAPSSFARPLDRDLTGTRVAWSPRLGDLPVDPTVLTVMEEQRSVFEQLGCEVVDVDPDLRAADEAFQTLRAWQFELGTGAIMDEHREQLKDTVIWNVEQGRALTGPDVGAAERARTELFHRFSDFMTGFDLLVCPVSQVPPFEAGTEWISEIDGTPMATYISWMQSCSRITVTGHPAASVPAGFTPDGLPVGLQFVGRHLDDFGVLQFAHAFERANPVGRQRPPL